MKLQIFKKDKLLTEYDVGEKAFTLGRADGNDIVINDTDLARQHIEFKKIALDTVSFVRKTTYGKVTMSGQDVREGELGPEEDLQVGSLRIVIEPEITTEKKLPEEDVPAFEQAENLDNKESESKKSDFELFTMSGGETDFKKSAESIASEGGDEENVHKEKTPGPKDDNEDSTGRYSKDKEDEVTDIKTDAGAKKSPKGEGSRGAFESSDATIVGSSLILYKLTAISGPYKDRQFNLERDSILIGRKKDSDIVLVEESVSREHAKLDKRGVNYYLTDLNSANGTKVNGKRITEPLMLTSGDIIELGSSVLRFMVVNPQVQGVKGVDLEPELQGKRVVVEKLKPGLSERELDRIEKSYGMKKEGPPKKNKKLLLLTLFAIVVALLLIPTEEEEEEKVEETKEEVFFMDEPEEFEQPDMIPELECLEVGSFCDLPPGLQRQLMAEYEVGVRLFKNFQFELAEDRAQQILSQVPDWPKAIELLEIANFEKEKLLAKKKQEEEAHIRKMLEERLAKHLREAEKHMGNRDYDKARESVSNVFEIDPTNERAKAIIDKIDEIMEQRRRAAQRRAEFSALLSRYRSTLDEGKKFHENKEYMKAIESFRRCLAFARSDSSQIVDLRDECSRRLDESNRMLRAMVSPELTVAEELFLAGQYREAIASYRRVLNMDYTNETAKRRIEEAQRAITQEAKDTYARAAVAESVSDISSACLLYYKVLQIAIPGTRYHNMALEKTRRLCTAPRRGN